MSGRGDEMERWDDGRFERLLRERRGASDARGAGSGAEPSREFEARLLEVLVAKQRALGRGPGAPAAPVRSRRPGRQRMLRAALLPLALAAGALIAALAGPRLAAPAPPGPEKAPTLSVPHLSEVVVARDREARPDTAPTLSVPHSGIPYIPLTAQGDAGTSERTPAGGVAAPGDRVEAAAGEPRTVRLPDGSTLFLDGGAAAVVSGEREIRLEGGRAFLEVARGAAPFDGAQGRPFRVVSGAGEALARGTKLAVEASGGALAVAVAQGSVLLRGAEAGGEVTLDAGEAGRVAPGAAPEAGPSPRLSHVIAWAREVYSARGAPVLDVESAVRPGAGEILVVDPSGQEARLSVRRLHVDVHVEDGVARTTIDTTYFNHVASRLEGTFTFPVPAGASISRLAMYVDGKLMEGGVAERDYARSVYESIVYRRRDPALLEWMEGNVFKMRIFPLEPRQEKRVIVSFVQDLESLYGVFRYALPLDAGRERVKRFSVEMRVKDGALGGRLPASTTYPLAAEPAGRDALLHFEADEFAPRRDLIVYIPDDASPARARAATFAEDDPSTELRAGGRRYAIARFSLSAHPERSAGERRRARAESKGPRTWAILVDASASRDAVELRGQREIVRRLLDELDDGDRFRLFSVGARPRPWKEAFEPARGARGPGGAERSPSGADRAGALAFIDGTRAIGATDLGAALGAAARALAGEENGHVVYVGDGIATDGEREPAKLAALVPAGIPFVGISVGKRVDSAFFTALAGASGGYHVHIDPDEPIAWRVFDLIAALNTPRLVAIEAHAVDERGEPVAADLQLSRRVAASGDEVRVVARFGPTPPAGILLRGRVDGRPFEQSVALAGAREGASYLPRLWARARVEELLREGAAGREAEIVSLGKDYFIATPFTSLLVLENDEMYAQFKVERGRKDRFALYAAPERIEVATEPLGAPFDSSGAPSAPLGSGRTEARTWADLEATVCRRSPPQLLYAYAPWGAVWSGAWTWNELDLGGFFPDIEVGQTRGGSIAGGFATVIRAGVPFVPAWEDAQRERDEKAERAAASGRRPITANPFGAPRDAFSQIEEGLRTIGRVVINDRSIDSVLGAGNKVGYRFDLRGPFAWRATATPAAPGWSGDRRFFVDESGVIRFDAIGVGSSAWLTGGKFWSGGFYWYSQRPQPQVDHRLHYDLTLLAPGLYTTDADVLALAEREAPEVAATVPATPTASAAPATVHVRRRLETGLVEEVHASEAWIWQVYPELGLAARRPRSRFHEPMLRAAAGDPAAEAASERPALDDLVVIDFPLRTIAVATERLGGASGEERAHLELQRAVATLWQNQGQDGGNWLRERITAGDRRLGLYALLTTIGWYQIEEFQEVARAHPESLLFRFTACAHEGAAKIEERLKIAAAGDGLIPALSLYLAAIDSLQAIHRDPQRVEEARARSLDLAERCAVRTSFGPFLYSLAWHLQHWGVGHSDDARERVIRLFDRAAASEDLAFAARYEAAVALVQFGRWADAAERLEAAYDAEMKAGRFPPFDASLKQALEQARDGGGTRYAAFAARAIDWAEGRKDAESLLVLAASARQAGDQALAERVLARLFRLVPRDGQDEAALAVARLCQQHWGDGARAERLVREVIGREGALAREPWVHEFAAALAQQRAAFAQAAADLERAIALDEARAADVVDLAAFRARHRQLVGAYAAVARATVLPGAADPGLAARVLAAADRWRALDRDHLELYAEVAGALLACGAEEAAWDAASTAIERRPAEAAGYVAAAGPYASAGRWDLAARIYARGAEVERTDPTCLFHEAQAREQVGEADGARALYERIAGGSWHDRFAGIVHQARAALAR